MLRQAKGLLDAGEEKSLSERGPPMHGVSVALGTEFKKLGRALACAPGAWSQRSFGPAASEGFPDGLFDRGKKFALCLRCRGERRSRNLFRALQAVLGFQY